MSKVLIVDDDPTILFLYKEELTDEGYDVITLNNCHGIIETIAKQKPDLIVLDINLGDINGLDVLQDIRNSYYDMHVILCTAYPAFNYDLKSLAADYYVVKSPDLTELKAKIKTAIETRRYLMKTCQNEKTEEEFYFSGAEGFAGHGI